MSPEDLSSASQVGAMVHLQPYLNRELDAIQRAVENKVRGLIAKGTLTPEVALQEWLAWDAAEALRRRFASKILAAQSVGARIQDQL